jgi:predicted dehydrogenase
MYRRELLKGVALGVTASGLKAAGEPLRFPKKIKVALVGLVGHSGTVLNPLNELPDVEVVAFAAPDPKEVARARRNPRLANARMYDSYSAMFNEERDLDIAAVCNDNGARAGAILAAADRGLHVIAEKPLALNRRDLAKIRQTLASKQRKIGMLMEMRYAPHYWAMRQIVSAGELGDVAQIASQKSYKTDTWPEWKSKRSTYGATIPWIGIHMIDLMRFTTGREYREVMSFASHVGMPHLGEADNVTASIFKLDNGGVANLRMDYLRPDRAPSHGDDRLRIAGTKGVLEYQPSTGLTLVTSNKEPQVLRDLAKPPLLLFPEFLDHVYNGKPTSMPEQDIWRVNEVTLAAQESAETGKIVRMLG